MYEAFYGLTSKPFQLNPDPTFYFGSKQHKRATAYLDYGVNQSQGFIVITGEVGAGKTTIVRNMLAKLDAKKVIAAQLVSTQLDAEDTLRLVGAAFGVHTKNVPKSDLLVTLEAFFTMAATEGKRCLLIVDEAQNLSLRAVEELRMLSNFQFDNVSLVQTFLIGQPEFRAILQSPEMLQLRQRVIATCHISAMDRQETQDYVEHRLKCAGYSGKPMFGPGCYDAIYASTGGVPRQINTLCDRVLLQGYLEDRKSFPKETVEAVAEEMLAEAHVPSKQSAKAIDAEMTAALTEALMDFGGDAPANLSDISLEDAEAVFANLGTSNMDERIRRLERSMLRIEKSNAAMLAVLGKILQELRVN
jgi:putative secretion ATPase (PEP-CTERM system associated)